MSERMSLDGLTVIVALMGVTDGLEVCTLPGANLGCFGDWVEINPVEVTLMTDRDVYLIHRRGTLGRTITWIGMYRKAYGMGQTRPGDFYGAGLWLLKRTSKPIGTEILSVLSWLCEQTRQWAVRNDQLVCRMEDVLRQVKIRPVFGDLQRIKESLHAAAEPRASEFLEGTSGYIDASTLESEGLSLRWLVDWALDDGPLFGEYSRVIIGTDPDAFAAGSRSSPPIRPHELRRRQALGRIEQRRQHHPRRRKTELARAARIRKPSYEEIAEREQHRSSAPPIDIEVIHHEESTPEPSRGELVMDPLYGAHQGREKGYDGLVDWRSALAGLGFFGGILTLIVIAVAVITLCLSAIAAA